MTAEALLTPRLRLGARYGGEIFSRGTVEGEHDVRDDAPFAVCTVLRG